MPFPLGNPFHPPYSPLNPLNPLNPNYPGLGWYHDRTRGILSDEAYECSRCGMIVDNKHDAFPLKHVCMGVRFP